MENRPLNLKTFKEKLKDPSSHKIKDQLLHFLNSISEIDTMIEKKLKIHNFTMMFEENLPKYPCWRSVKYSEIEEASEVLEYIITKEKYNILFGVDNFSREQDESLMKSYENLEFVQPYHLDISSSLAEDCLIQVAGNRKRSAGRAFAN